MPNPFNKTLHCLGEKHKAHAQDVQGFRVRNIKERAPTAFLLVRHFPSFAIQYAVAMTESVTVVKFAGHTGAICGS